MLKKKIQIFLYLSFLSLALASLSGMVIFKKQKLTREELIGYGHKMLIFGSQNSNGLDLYDIRQGELVNLIKPDSDKYYYAYPVINKEGIGFCLKKTFFDLSQNDNLVKFNLNNRSVDVLENVNIYASSAIAISNDGKKLALIYADHVEKIQQLGIFNVEKEQIEKKFPLDHRFVDNKTNLTWKGDGKTVVFWDTISNLPALELNTENATTKRIDIYPFSYEGNNVLFKRNGDIYVVGEKGTEIQIELTKKTIHSLSLSKNGNLISFGWLRGLGFENLVVKEIESNKDFELEMDHPGTVLGLALW